jgi:hypothetical protein
MKFYLKIFLKILPEFSGPRTLNHYGTNSEEDVLLITSLQTRVDAIATNNRLTPNEELGLVNKLSAGASVKSSPTTATLMP